MNNRPQGKIRQTSPRHRAIALRQASVLPARVVLGHVPRLFTSLSE